MLEREIKRRVTALLKLAKMHGQVYHWMTVITGFGKRSLDYICCINGQFLAIETKAPGDWLRPDQRDRARDMMLAGGKVFCVSGPVGYAALERYLVSQIPSLKKALRPVVW
jgi:hypothetical protein